MLLLIIALSGCVGGGSQNADFTASTADQHTSTQTPTSTPIYEQSIDQTPELPFRRIELGSNISNLNVTEVEIGVYTRINTARESDEQHHLYMDNRLQKIARRHSYSMVTEGFYSHVDPHFGGPTRRMTNLGYECPNMYGETIHAVPYNVTLDMYNDTYDLSIEEEISRFIVDAWLNSPAHRTELLQEEYDVVGVGIFVSKDARILVTAEFCG